jgi:uncharacterized protein (DUF433 family)
MGPLIEKQHIEATPGTCGGKPRIAGHRVRVQDIVLWSEHGQSPEEITRHIPSITLADVHAALAYYYDHQEQIDADLRAEQAFAARAKADAGPGLIGRLRDQDAGPNSVSP